MSSLRKQLEALLNKDDLSPSLIYWNALLNFYLEQNKNNFDLETMRMLCEESERCREYWNTPRMKTVSFMKGMDDVPQYTEVEEKGLDIEKGDVYPRIYDFLMELQLRQAAKEFEANRRNPDPIPSGQALVPVPA